MDITQQEKKVTYGLYKAYSRYAPGPSFIMFYAEDADILCNNRVVGKADGISLSEYSGILDSTRGQDVNKLGEYQHVSRGGVTLASLSRVKCKLLIQKLIQAGAVPDEEFTTYLFGDNSEEWDYLSKLYLEYLTRKRAKPASVVRESITS